MRVLVACEFSGIVREAFKRLGHEAMSCDLLNTEIPGNHYKGDVRNILDGDWDLLIAHPPCTHLAVSGARWFKDKMEEQEEALFFVAELMDAPIPRTAIENPIGVISTNIRKPDQIIQPWQFGDPFQKSTCLWLRGLPELLPTKVVDKGKMQVCKSGKTLPEWYSNNKKLRSRTFPGIANAMAEQWATVERHEQ